MSAKKQFNIENLTDKFFTQPTQETEDIQNTQNNEDTQKKPVKKGRPKKERPLRIYRYSLLLDDDLDPFLHEMVWTKRTSMTQYINDLIRREKEIYVKDCLERGVIPYEGWKEENESEDH